MRETLFNWLQIDIHQANCLDLFAGSGALGLEALSRGARHCTFVDNHPVAIQQLRENLTKLDCNNATVLNEDALGYLRMFQQTPPEESIDILFIDPPFAAELWDETLLLLEKSHGLSQGAAIYIEAPINAHFSVPNSWSLHRHKRSGNVCCYLYYLT
ncbi:ribosomal RNA small subunit methyltransferase D [Marinibactrum halimedae]|uniref:Ribosomal RNA small subunit methyltransferase D n=2 Tax=Marinibactrum halimedae TaxID=1444977 RepID=A0AA37T929_9GAMM|nr:ribosomal RNA small subunit methyltransferase D [Marinibactrum halimedae]